jgi:pimeloyl-ACP methyl ester carboxylesterase
MPFLVYPSNIRDEKFIHESIKGSQIEWIDGAGHEIYVDRASECIAAIEKFINRLHSSK